ARRNIAAACRPASFPRGAPATSATPCPAAHGLDPKASDLGSRPLLDEAAAGASLNAEARLVPHGSSRRMWGHRGATLCRVDQIKRQLVLNRGAHAHAGEQNTTDM
ncbi:unnamed protein product, partial [Urochloa humidicola]